MMVEPPSDFFFPLLIAGVYGKVLVDFQGEAV
jgi:hypothetical protein